MGKRKLIKELFVIFWLFVIGSILGYLLEMCVGFVQNGYFESRKGLIYGPFTPVYGVGIVIYYIVIKNVRDKSKINVFLITMLVGGITEYLFSFMQEKLYGTVSWDYSSLIFNINGRTSLLHCCYWGLGGILYLMGIEPIIKKLEIGTKIKMMKTITTVLVVFVVFDINISCLAANRQTERRRGIPAQSKMDEFLDIYYPDEYMDKIYANKKEIN